MDGYGNYTSEHPEMVARLCGADRGGVFRIRCTRPIGHDRHHRGKRFNRMYFWDQR